PGEESVVLRVHRALRHSLPDLLTMIVPRHPERGSEIAALTQKEGYRVLARSMGRLPDQGTDVYLADTIGEMGLHYRVAPVSFIGGSLIPHGGQNPIEAAKLGTAIIHGPDVHSFPEIYSALGAADAATQVTGAESLAAAVQELLTDADLRDRRCHYAQRAIMEFEGALEATVDAIEPLLTAFSVAAALERARA
ncbi:MAG: 3-deoxy-D-manno-octulosonic acid transferase, partial [Devosiaceae bacterium]|nr:3-deoxy-D-manno-octulosonic acid transferase [Devosiaceae bacterium MH13]